MLRRRTCTVRRSIFGASRPAGASAAQDQHSIGSRIATAKLVSLLVESKPSLFSISASKACSDRRSGLDEAFGEREARAWALPDEQRIAEQVAQPCQRMANRRAVRLSCSPPG
jgi:hypothetical protein